MSENNFNICLLTKEDKNKVDELIKENDSTLVNPAFWLPIQKEAYEHFFDTSWTWFYGLFIKDKLIGMAALFLNKEEYGETCLSLNIPTDSLAEIGRAYISPSYRGHNLITSIYQVLQMKGKELGIKHLLATVHPDNIPSLKALEKFGMVKIGHLTKYNSFQRDVFFKDI